MPLHPCETVDVRDAAQTHSTPIQISIGHTSLHASVAQKGKCFMNQLQSTIERGLQAQQVLDRPKEVVPATVFSVYAPRDLVIAFKRVCKAQRRPHGSIMRQLMADYIDDALKTSSDQEE